MAFQGTKSTADEKIVERRGVKLEDAVGAVSEKAVRCLTLRANNREWTLGTALY
jgi:hypothetical protein